tara:strand:+ start:1744 stop:2685 length:942 start_codon:yes stop_codon:yes gene_type:complete
MISPNEQKYWHLFPYMTDHNHNTCGHTFEEHKQRRYSAVFPSKLVNVVTARRFVPSGNFPRTVTTSVVCCKQRHAITFGIDGSIILHGPDTIEELKTMAMFSGEKPRRLQVYEAWMACTSFEEAKSNWGDHVLSQYRKDIPQVARQTLNWAYKTNSGHYTGDNPKIVNREIQLCRSQYRRSWEGGRKPSLQEKLQEHRYNLAKEYFGHLWSLFNDMYRPYICTWKHRIDKQLKWFHTVRKLRLHQVKYVRTADDYSNVGKVFDCFSFPGRSIKTDVIATVVFRDRKDENKKEFCHAHLVSDYNQRNWRIAEWL